MLGSARQLRLRPAAVAFALGEAIELQDDADVVRQHQDLDAAAQAAQAERDHRLAQLGRAGDVAAPLVERHIHLKPLVTHWVSSRIVPRTEAVDRMPVACAGCEAGHGPMRVLSFPSPSGWRDQMTAFIGRREFITLLGGALAAWPLAARAQDRMRRISVINVIAATDPEASPRIAAFEAALSKLGWSKTHNLEIDYHWDVKDIADARVLARQVMASKPDLLVTVTTPPTQAFRDEAGDTTPIVFLQVFDPVSTGLVASLPRPGGNITGFAILEPSMASKWAQLLKEIAPHIETITLLFNPTTTPGVQLYLDSVEATKIFLVRSTAVHSVEDLSAAISGLARNRNAGLIIPPDVFMTKNRDLITSLAAQHRVPAVYPFHYFATFGGLLSYGVDSTDLFRRAASYVDAILRGTKPADLPVQLPTKFQLVINLKTARALGLEVPPTLLATADEVIE